MRSQFDHNKREREREIGCTPRAVFTKRGSFREWRERERESVSKRACSFRDPIGRGTRRTSRIGVTGGAMESGDGRGRGRGH